MKTILPKKLPNKISQQLKKESEESIKTVKKLNDLKATRSENTISEAINDNSKPTFSFYALLMASTIICTLGLLMNASAVVIGGMIISPLMWPILSLAIGISYGRNKTVRRSTLNLLIAITVAFVSAALITFVSPIKIINAEILARTEPTFLDLIVAVAAGAIAALAISHRRISSSLAGVAIATSLLPPLCVSAIGLSLFDINVFSGAMLLFAANVSSILFVAIIVFSYIGLRNRKFSEMRLKGLLITVTILIMIANPLITLLQQKSFEIWSYPEVNRVLEEQLKTFSQSIKVGLIEVEVNHDSSITISAQLLLPDDTVINYQQQQKLISELEKVLSRPVNLQLNLQRTISVLSENDQEKASQQKEIRVAFEEAIANYRNVDLDSLQIELNSDKRWRIDAVVRSDFQTLLPLNLTQQIETAIFQATGQKAVVKLEVVPRQTFSSANLDELQDLAHSLENLLAKINPQLSLTSLKTNQAENKNQISNTKQDQTLIIQMITPRDFTLTKADQLKIRSLVDQYLSQDTEIEISLVPSYRLQL